MTSARSGGLSAKTLLIAGAASAAAALVIPMLWRPGTVFAAAMTPVVVALVTELLRRPVETVSAVRRAAHRARHRDPRLRRRRSRSTRSPPPSAEELAVLPEETAPPRAVHRRRPLTGAPVEARARHRASSRSRRVAAVVTASELVAGDARLAAAAGARRSSAARTSARDEQARRPRQEEKGAVPRSRRPDGDPAADRHTLTDARPRRPRRRPPRPPAPTPVPAEPAPAP